MAVQTKTDLAISALVIRGLAVYDSEAVIAQDAGRSAVLAFGTVMARVAATKKWVPLTNLAATDGSALPRGIYVGPDIAAATIVAGDVSNVPIITGGGDGSLLLNSAEVVFENSLTVDSVIGATTIHAGVVSDYMAALMNSFIVTGIDISDAIS